MTTRTFRPRAGKSAFSSSWASGPTRSPSLPSTWPNTHCRAEPGRPLAFRSPTRNPATGSINTATGSIRWESLSRGVPEPAGMSLPWQSCGSCHSYSVPTSWCIGPLQRKTIVTARRRFGTRPISYTRRPCIRASWAGPYTFTDICASAKICRWRGESLP